jgi:hypothetical protein
VKGALWALAGVGALFLGGWALGWQGVVLVLTALVVLLLLQFRKLMRVMNQAGRGPIGQVPDAAHFHAQLRPGQALVDVLALAGSLGESVPNQAHTYRWRDPAGNEVWLHFNASGQLQDLQLQRAS